MIQTLVSTALLFGGDATAAEQPAPPRFEFEAPTRVLAGGSPIRVEAPGYASPCLADMNADGHADLVVGQFNGGKIQVFPSDGEGNYGAGRWLQAGGQVAEVPGVW